MLRQEKEWEVVIKAEVTNAVSVLKATAQHQKILIEGKILVQIQIHMQLPGKGYSDRLMLSAWALKSIKYAGFLAEEIVGGSSLAL